MRRSLLMMRVLCVHSKSSHDREYLAFAFHSFLPHYIECLEVSRTVGQRAWAFLNDALRSDACLVSTGRYVCLRELQLSYSSYA